jgi:hypothetical protein
MMTKGEFLNRFQRQPDGAVLHGARQSRWTKRPLHDQTRRGL